MSSIDRKTAKEIGEATEAALQSVAEQFGLTVTVRGGSYDPTVGTFSPKIIFAEADAAQNEFNQYASMFGLDACHFGAEFSSGGRRFRISGIKPRATKMPILATEINSSRVYKFTPDAIAKALRKAVA